MMERRKRTIFLAFFLASALLHVVVIAKLSVPPPAPLPQAESMLVILPPAPQPEPEPSDKPVVEQAPAQPLQLTSNPVVLEEAAIPDFEMPPLNLDKLFPPIKTAPPPPEVDESPVTLPVAPTHTIPGDPTNESIVRAWLERHKRYPRIAALRRSEGEALLYLQLDSQGRVVRALIRTSSTHLILDREVLKMVNRAQPFPLVPETTTNTEYLIPVDFRLE
jgi:protein TonB